MTAPQLKSFKTQIQNPQISNSIQRLLDWASMLRWFHGLLTLFLDILKNFGRLKNIEKYWVNFEKILEIFEGISSNFEELKTKFKQIFYVNPMKNFRNI